MGGFQSTWCVIRDNAESSFVFWWIPNFLKKIGALVGWVVLRSNCYVTGYEVERELMLLFTSGYLQFNMTISVFKPFYPAEYLERRRIFFNPNGNSLGKNGNYEADHCSNLPAGQLT